MIGTRRQALGRHHDADADAELFFVTIGEVLV
jgi:hypothetical protein